MRPEIYLQIAVLGSTFVLVCLAVYVPARMAFDLVADVRKRHAKRKREKYLNMLRERVVATPRAMAGNASQWLDPDGLPSLVQDIYYGRGPHWYGVIWFDGERGAVPVERAEDALNIPLGAHPGTDWIVQALGDYMEKFPGEFRPEFHPANQPKFHRQQDSEFAAAYMKPVGAV